MRLILWIFHKGSGRGGGVKDEAVILPGSVGGREAGYFNQAFVNGPDLLHQRHAATAKESNDKCEESQHSLGSLLH